MFADQGWEYINSTFNGWHYFRKKYDENMTADDSQIYTDKESLYEMQDRFLKMCHGISIMEGVMAVFYLIMSLVEAQPVIFAEGFLMAAMCVFLKLVEIDRKKKREGEQGFLKIGAGAFFQL